MSSVLEEVSSTDRVCLNEVYTMVEETNHLATSILILKLGMVAHVYNGNPLGGHQL